MQQLRQHPDLGDDHWNAALINEAYAVISNPRKRAEYDCTLLHANPASTVTSVSPRKQSRQHQSAVQDACTFCGTAHHYGRNPQQDAACSECASPLMGIETPRLEKSCRRMVHRIAKNIQVVFYTAWPQQVRHAGVVQDISPRGMQFFTDKPPETGVHIKVEW